MPYQVCTDLVSHFTAASPRIVVLDAYDGLYAGIAACGVCEAEYRLDLIDWRVDDNGGDDLRVFAVKSLPPGSVERFCAVLGRDPIWPVWTPIWRFASPEKEHQIREQADDILRQAGPPHMVLAARGIFKLTFLRSESLATPEDRDIAEQSIGRSAKRVRDWLAFLELQLRHLPDHPRPRSDEQ
jgi:hypothetical protein